MIESPRVQVFILTRNRPEFLSHAIRSVLKQTYKNIELVVSDNSTNEETKNFLLKEFGDSDYKYIRRNPPQSVFGHLNQILSEVTGQFAMLFHDDDILLPHALEKMVEALNSNPVIAAVSCNANVVNKDGQYQNIFNRYLVTDFLIKDSEELAKQYIKFPMEVAPFPAYLYRSNYLKVTSFLYKEGRKHADVSLLMKIAKQGPILWLAEPLMNYRIHGNNDSGFYDIKAIFSLCRFLRSQTAITKDDLDTFKIQSLLAWLRFLITNKKVFPMAKSSKVFVKHLLCLALRRPLRFMQTILNSK